MKTKLYYLVAIIAIALSACKDDDEIPGPQGPAGATGATGSTSNMVSGGYIQGNITGTQSNGAPYSIDFNYTYYGDPEIIKQFSSPAIYYFYIYRYPTSHASEPGSCNVQVTLDSLNQTPPRSFGVTGRFYKDLGSNQLLEIFVSGTSTSPTTLTNYIYNNTTHIASGNFLINVGGINNSTGNPATLSGSFQTIPMIQYVSRIGY